MNQEPQTKNKIIKTLLLITLIITFQSLYLLKVNLIYADDVDSTNYKIKDLTVGSGGGEDESSSNYRLLQSIGDNINDDRFSSSNYKLGVGVAYNWMATAPSIQCFETTTEGSTSCSDADVNPDGMVMVCGDGGCFDRARFELNAENNPSDTLYSIQITTDSGWSSWEFIDGVTFMIETSANHNINDYLTESSWEGTASNINALGLSPGTTYYLRATALCGDFTESDPGPAANTATGYPLITFDLDIAGTGGSSTETSSPYTIDLEELGIGSVTTASDLIWLDIGSNASGGTIISVLDDYTGLNSVSASYTITSANADLNSASEGYGLQEYSSTESYLGPLTAEPAFGNAGNTVGGISTSPINIYNTSTDPIYGGRSSLYVKAKASNSTPAADDYQDEITFRVVGTY